MINLDVFMVNFSVFLFGYRAFRRFSKIKEDIVKAHKDSMGIYTKQVFYFKGGNILDSISIKDAMDNPQKAIMHITDEGPKEISFEDFKKITLKEDYERENKEIFVKTENARKERNYYIFGAILVLFATQFTLIKTYNGSKTVPIIVFILYFILGSAIVYFFDKINK
jgi:hypothetical protein